MVSYDPAMANGWGDGERGGRFATVLALAGGGIAVVAVVLAGAKGAPYLEADGVNAWIVVFAAGLLAGFLAFPFGLEVRLRDRIADRDRRWEVTLVAWGALAAAALALSIAVGFDTGTLSGAAALIVAIEAGLVVATVVVWLVAGG